jgi:hypothetical protein
MEGYAPSSPLFIFLSFGYQKKEKRTKKKYPFEYPDFYGSFLT